MMYIRYITTPYEDEKALEGKETIENPDRKLYSALELTLDNQFSTEGSSPRRISVQRSLSC